MSARGRQNLARTQPLLSNFGRNRAESGQSRRRCGRPTSAGRCVEIQVAPCDAMELAQPWVSRQKLKIPKTIRSGAGGHIGEQEATKRSGATLEIAEQTRNARTLPETKNGFGAGGQRSEQKRRTLGPMPLRGGLHRNRKHKCVTQRLRGFSGPVSAFVSDVWQTFVRSGATPEPAERLNNLADRQSKSKRLWSNPEAKPVDAWELDWCFTMSWELAQPGKAREENKQREGPPKHTFRGRWAARRKMNQKLVRCGASPRRLAQK